MHRGEKQPQRNQSTHHLEINGKFNFRQCSERFAEGVFTRLATGYTVTLLATDGGNPYSFSMLRFTKMNGAGNDFVMIDNRTGDVQLSPEQIVRICDRHRGVGADGILLLEKGSNGADFRMRYYN